MHTHKHTQPCIPTYTCTHMCIHTHIHSHIHVYTCIYMYIHPVHTYIHTYIPTYLPTYLHTYITTYMHACMHTYMHACMHAYIHTATTATTTKQPEHMWFRAYDDLSFVSRNPCSAQVKQVDPLIAVERVVVVQLLQDLRIALCCRVVRSLSDQQLHLLQLLQLVHVRGVLQVLFVQHSNPLIQLLADFEPFVCPLEG